MDELLTVRQVARLLQLHEMTIRRYIKSGKLDAVRIGRNVRVPRRAVDALLQEQNAVLREAAPAYQVQKETPTHSLPARDKAFEQFVADILDRLAHGGIDLDDHGDPLLKLAGTIESDVPDVADRHDYYIGMAIYEDGK